MASKVEEEKLVVNSQKEGQWLEETSKCLDDMHDKLRGKLLTTIEVTLPAGKQLEAFKSRVKDVQGEVWDILQARKYQQFANWFSVLKPDESTDTKLSEEEFGARVAKFQKDLDQVVTEELDWFKKIVVSLIVLAIEDREKKEALKWEVERLIGDASHKLRRWLGGIKNIFLEVK